MHSMRCNLRPIVWYQTVLDVVERAGSAGGLLEDPALGDYEGDDKDRLGRLPFAKHLSS